MNIDRIIESVIREELGEKKDSICGFEAGNGFAHTQHRPGTSDEKARYDAKNALERYNARLERDDDESFGLHRGDTPERREWARSKKAERRANGPYFDPKQISMRELSEAVDMAISRLMKRK